MIVGDIPLGLLIFDVGGAAVKRWIDLDDPPVNRPAYTRSLALRWIFPLLWPLLGLVQLIRPPFRSEQYRDLHYAEYGLIASAGLTAAVLTVVLATVGLNHTLSAIVGLCAAPLIYALGMGRYRQFRARRSHFHIGEKERLAETWKRRKEEREAAYAACQALIDSPNTAESFARARELHETFMSAIRLEGEAFIRLRRLDPKLAKELHESYGRSHFHPH